MTSLTPPNEPSPEALRKVAKGVFRFIQVVGVTIRKSGSRGILEEHLFATLDPPPARPDFDTLIAAFIEAKLVQRLSGTGGKSAVLYWVGPHIKKGAI